MEGSHWAGCGGAAPPPEPRPTFSQSPISVDSMGTATGRPEDSWAGGVCLFQNMRHQPGQRAARSYSSISKSFKETCIPFSMRRPEIPHTAARGALISVGRMLCPSSRPSGAPHLTQGKAQVLVWALETLRDPAQPGPSCRGESAAACLPPFEGPASTAGP